MSELDTTIVDLHRIDKPQLIARVDGEAFRVHEEELAEPLREGVELKIGDTIALAPGASVLVGDRMLRGGKRGHAHAFVAESAFRASPNMSDVPKLLEQLAEIELRVEEKFGVDPLSMQQSPQTPCDRAAAAEFARLNLSQDVSRLLPESLARSIGAVPLFLCDEAAFVAMSVVTISKLRQLMEALGRPVNPHLVEETVLAELIERAYHRRRVSAS